MLQSHTEAFGKLAAVYCCKELPLGICQSAGGFFIGTWDNDVPCTRESAEIFLTAGEAHEALATGCWTQRGYF